MEEKKNFFDPLAWVNKSEENVVGDGNKLLTMNQSLTVENTELAKATATAEELLLTGANIAESYDDYVRLGFALADGLGADGRELYHRLCAQSTKYREADCEKKWRECLSKHDGRTTIATFYNMAKQSGVDLSAVSRQFSAVFAIPHGSTGYNESGQKDNVNNMQVINNKDDITFILSNAINTDNALGSGAELRKLRKTLAAGTAADDETRFAYSETFSDKLEVPKLPSILQEVLATQDDDDSRDKVLLSALVLFSGNMPNVEGLYGNKRVGPPLYLLLNAPSGTRKGEVADCQQLLMPIEKDIRHQYEQALEDYECEHQEWAALDNKQKRNTPEPQCPKHLSLFIAANSSSAIVYEDLKNNGERGTIFETEADTLAAVLTQDWGQWSDLMRKAFHHERATLSRKSESTRIVIEHPSLAVLLTCTPGQIPALLPSTQVENGLANRFLFYCLKGSNDWEDPFKSTDKPLSDKMYHIGWRFKDLYGALRQRVEKPIEFTFSDMQRTAFNGFFDQLHHEQTGMNGKELSAFIFRLGLSTYRIAMVLSVLRCLDRMPMINPNSSVLVCNDDDFKTSLTIANTLINHTCHVYSNLLPHVKKQLVADGVKMLDAQQQFFLSLPDEFRTDVWKDVAQSLNIRDRTAERYLGEFINKYHLVTRVQNGQFVKK